MKKFIALSLAAIMVVSVCACGSEKTKSAGKEIFSCYDLHEIHSGGKLICLF